MWNATLDEAQAGIKISGRNINNLRYADDTILMAESKEELNSLLIISSQRGEWKSWLKIQHSKNEDHGIQSHHFMQANGIIMKTVIEFIFLGSKITADSDWGMKLKMLSPWKKSYEKPILYIKKQRHDFVDKGLYSQSYVFSSSHVWMWKLNHKEGWVLKNWCFRTMVLEKTPESPLGCKEIKPFNPKWNQPWIFSGKTGAEAEVPIIWPPVVKSRLTGKDWCSERLKARGEGDSRGWDVGWHHRLTGHDLKKALGVGDGQESLPCCSSWGHRVGHDW